MSSLLPNLTVSYFAGDITDMAWSPTPILTGKFLPSYGSGKFLCPTYCITHFLVCFFVLIILGKGRYFFYKACN